MQSVDYLRSIVESKLWSPDTLRAMADEMERAQSRAFALEQEGTAAPQAEKKKTPKNQHPLPPESKKKKTKKQKPQTGVLPEVLIGSGVPGRATNPTPGAMGRTDSIELEYTDDSADLVVDAPLPARNKEESRQNLTSSESTKDRPINNVQEDAQFGPMFPSDSPTSAETKSVRRAHRK